MNRITKALRPLKRLFRTAPATAVLIVTVLTGTWTVPDLCVASALDAFVQNQRLGRGVNILGYDPIWRSRDQARFPISRWGVQRGTAVIPKTSTGKRLKENLALFDFRLNEDEMKAISALNRNRRFNDPGDFCEKAFNTFFPIYE